MARFIKLGSPINFISVYIRVSSKMQSTDIKYGLASQLEICNNYTQFYSKDTPITVWKDIGSSYKNNKILPDMNSLLLNLKPKTLILVSEVSRLGRSYKMIEDILNIVRRKKSFIVSITENIVFGKTRLSDIKFLEKIKQSERESDVLSMRTRNIQNYIRQKGGYIGKPPFGYKITKNSKNIPVLTENPEHFKFIDEIVNLSNICSSYCEIKDILNKKNFLHNDKLWTSARIKFILNKFYPEHTLTNPIHQSKLSNRIKNTIYGSLKINICSNEEKNITDTPSSIRLRSGREIIKF